MEIYQQTLLLIIILCFIFYVMHMSSCEGFEATEKQENHVQEHFEPEYFTQGDYHENFEVVLPQEKPTQLVSVLNSNTMANMQSNTVPQTIVQSETAKKVMSDSIYNFQGNDSFGDGADLNAAFQPPIPVQNSADAVTMNKNNEKYNAKDFLPKEINNKWFDTDFSQAKYNVNNDTLINTDRYVIGINTVGQSLKNASYDIRGTIPNPKYTISPWNNSTYEPDYNLKPLCTA